MYRRRASIFIGAIFVATIGSSSRAGTRASRTIAAPTALQFIGMGFFEYDTRAHLQIDGREVTLARRFAVSGARYSGGGVTLKITRAGTTVRHARRPATTCELT